MNILAAAGDAGGARALTPVIRRLRADGGAVTCLAGAAAAGIWTGAGLPPASGPVDPAAFDGVLLGTSVGGEQLELRLVLTARERCVPTVSVLDFWVNYRERFTAGDGMFVLPDSIAVMDECARDDMIAVGFPRDRLCVTGHPGFDELGRFRAPGARRLAAAAVRGLAACPSDDLCILYVSQPLSALWGPRLGFDERDVLETVVQTLGRALERRARRAYLLVKPHPREAAKFARPTVRAPGNLSITVLSGIAPDPLELAKGSDLVIGMNSMLLMEACLIGTPVVSYQPDLQIADPLPSNRYGWSRAVYRALDLEAALEAELFDDRARADRVRRLERIAPPSGATDRVVALLKRAGGDRLMRGSRGGS